MARFILTACFAVTLWAESPPRPVLQNNGKPMRVRSDCSLVQIQALGLPCTDTESCPLFLELTDSGAVGNRTFLTGNLHTAGATLESLLLASEDDGKTWSEPQERIAGAGLEGIQFTDFEAGWVGGQMLGSLPRDPFILLTTDGGKTWRKRSILNEPGLGVIDGFWFTSRQSGSLLIDRVQGGESGMRHEMYETMTGGESWMLRAVNSKPIPIKRPVQAERTWQVRADAATKAYRVERRQGSGWQLIASFLIDAGECRPPAPREPAVEPPADEVPPSKDPGVLVVPTPKPKKNPL